MYPLQLFLNGPLDQQRYRSTMLPGTYITHNATNEWHHLAGLSDQMLLLLEPQKAFFFTFAVVLPQDFTNTLQCVKLVLPFN